MKKLLLFIGLSLIAFCCNAQEGAFLYTEYDCDILTEGNYVDVCFDVDFDGQSDLNIVRIDGSTTEHLCGFLFARNYWNPSDTTLFAPYWGQTEGLGHNSLQTGDTIANCVNWQEAMQIVYDYPYEPMPLDGYRFYLGTRKRVGDSFIYGWLDLQMFWSPELGYLHIHLYGTAFSTFPDYPLMAGQTSLNWSWDVEENTTNAFATLYPNPTNGLVTITDQELKSAEVYNTLGQCVATSTGEGERLTVDITHLPAGVYVVNVTDTEGRKCVRKVVKE